MLEGVGDLEVDISNETVANLIYDILVSTCGASDNGWGRYDFVHHFPTSEYRFQGSLGFGGKFWVNHGCWYVNCYREDETPGRLDAIASANVRLENLYQDILKLSRLMD
jgi:hypothetical protein